MSEHACAAPGCDRLVPAAYVLCAVHWRELRQAAAAEVTAAYRRWRAGELSLQQLRAELLAAVAAARGPRVCRVCLADALAVATRTTVDGLPVRLVEDGTAGVICTRCVDLLAGVPLGGREGGAR